MKILLLSDLHLQGSAKRYERIFKHTKPDIIVITGDIYESNIHPSMVYRNLSAIFTDIPVVCTLGNHEFYYNTVEYIIEEYKKYYNPSLYNIHYLDIIHKYDINNIRFIGNVLWYDGSMSTVKNQNINSFADNTWMDYTIKNFNFIDEYKNNINTIKLNIDNNKTNILCTHCVPHRSLNGHMYKTYSQYNAYSGSCNLLEQLNVQYSFCGHTHLPIETIIKTNYGECMCYNVGNDYFKNELNVKYKIMEI